MLITNSEALELMERARLAEVVFVEILKIMQENQAEINRLRRVIADYERSKRCYSIAEVGDGTVEVRVQSDS